MLLTILISAASWSDMSVHESRGQDTICGRFPVLPGNRVGERDLDGGHLVLRAVGCQPKFSVVTTFAPVTG
jgi:hypothetical protein